VADGKLTIRGYALEWIAEGSLFRVLGLRTGDVLVGIGDTRFTLVTDGLVAFPKYRTAKRIPLHVLRDGRQETLTYETP
jgi:type II secretory pathway component PulC